MRITRKLFWFYADCIQIFKIKRDTNHLKGAWCSVQVVYRHYKERDEWTECYDVTDGQRVTRKLIAILSFHVRISDEVHQQDDLVIDRTNVFAARQKGRSEICGR